MLTVGVLACVSHGENTGSGVLQLAILITVSARSAESGSKKQPTSSRPQTCCRRWTAASEMSAVTLHRADEHAQYLSTSTVTAS